MRSPIGVLLPACLILVACDDPSAGPEVTSLAVDGSVTELLEASIPVPGAVASAHVPGSTDSGAVDSDSTDAAGTFELELQVPGGCDPQTSLDLAYRAEARDFRPMGTDDAPAIATFRCDSDPQSLDIQLYREVFRSPQTVTGIPPALQLSAGTDHACVTTAGGAYCWGSGVDGLLGNAAWEDTIAHEPVPVTGGGSFTAVAAGVFETCAVDSEAVAWCWGWVIAAHQSAEPIQLPTDLRFKQVTPGYTHTCGLTVDGAVYCWGNRDALGIGPDTSGTSPEYISTPTRAALEGRFTHLSVAKRWHTCALRDTGDIYCWGFTHGAELGGAEGDSTRYVLSPVRVPGDHDWAMVDAGNLFTCGLTTAGAAYCWGREVYGLLGRGVDEGVKDVTPTAVAGGHVFAGITTGWLHACGWTAAGEAYCWGDNGLGGPGVPVEQGDQCGDAPCVLQPTRVAIDLVFDALEAGGGFTCGLANGSVYCWGKREALGSGRQIME